MLWSTAWFCAIFGAVLGWLQIHNERRPDLWAFLMHRPMTRTGIFLGKAMAGLGLYAAGGGRAAAGLHRLGAVAGAGGGAVRASMLRPLAAFFLAGTVCYFAGMLTGLRQARWYASRALGLGVAIVVIPLMWESPAFWQGLRYSPDRRGDSDRGSLGRVPKPGLLPGPAGGGKAAPDRRAHARAARWLRPQRL